MVDSAKLKYYDEYWHRHYGAAPTCINCGADISRFEKFGYVKTKRKSEHFVCEKCAKGFPR